MNIGVGNTKKYYRGLDGLRAYAAIGVALMHILSNGCYALEGFISEKIIGSMGEFVYLFMVISGFSMCCGYFDKVSENKITVGEFYSKRYKKIWPYFALLCLIDLLLSPSLESLYETFANLTLCFGLLPNANISVIGVGWFLGVVFVFYLIFPFFCWLLQDKRRAWFAFCIALLFNFLCQVYFFDSNHMIAGFDTRSSFLFCSVYFFAGGMIYLYRDRLCELCNAHRVLIWILCVIAATVFIFIGNSTLILLIFCSLLLIYGIGNTGGVLRNQFTHFISDISMEIYLCHMMMFRVIEKVHLTHVFESDLFSYIATSLGTLVCAVIFSFIVKRMIELIEDKIKEKVS